MTRRRRGFKIYKIKTIGGALAYARWEEVLLKPVHAIVALLYLHGMWVKGDCAKGASDDTGLAANASGAK